jgi:hypothetical protein
VAEGVGSGFAPAHAAAFEPIANDGFAGGFHGTGTDLPALGEIAGVVHPMAMIAKVRELLAVALADRLAAIAQIQALQARQNRSAAFVFQAVAPYAVNPFLSFNYTDFPDFGTTCIAKTPI